MARIIATIAAGLLAALCVSAQSSDVTIAGYTTTDCTGEPALTYTFTGGPGVCQSVTYNGMTVYGKVYCENGQPAGTFCGTDSACSDSSCTSNLAAAGNGVCGDGYNLFTSAVATCGTSTATSSQSTGSSNSAASSNAAGIVGIAAAAAASVAALL